MFSLKRMSALVFTLVALCLSGLSAYLILPYIPLGALIVFVTLLVSANLLGLMEIYFSLRTRGLTDV